MTLSRKNFFKHGFFSLGDTLLKASGAVREVENSSDFPTVDMKEDNEPVPDTDKVATAENQYCLAKNCGCFSCVDRCESGAILIIPGTGITINETLCTGCGTCHYVCPVTPKAITLNLRKT